MVILSWSGDGMKISSINSTLEVKFVGEIGRGNRPLNKTEEI